MPWLPLISPLAAAGYHRQADEGCQLGFPQQEGSARPAPDAGGRASACGARGRCRGASPCTAHLSARIERRLKVRHPTMAVPHTFVLRLFRNHCACPQNKCGDAKALDLIMAATATGCTALSCSWAVDSIPLSIKLNLNVRRWPACIAGLCIWHRGWDGMQAGVPTARILHRTLVQFCPPARTTLQPARKFHHVHTCRAAPPRWACMIPTVTAGWALATW